VKLLESSALHLKHIYPTQSILSTSESVCLDHCNCGSCKNYG